MPKKKCIYCRQPIAGRSDKKFCSIDCKNSYHYDKRKQTKSITKVIDRILHRNYEILAELMGKRKKLKVDRIQLEMGGFNFNYITGYYVNTNKKTYHYVYNYAWMEFSTQEVLVVRK